MSQQTKLGSRPFCCARMQTEKATGTLSRELIWLIRESNSPICNITSFICQIKDTLDQKISLWFPGSSYSFSCPLSLPRDSVIQLNHKPSFFLWVYLRCDGATDKDNLCVISACSHLALNTQPCTCKMYLQPCTCKIWWNSIETTKWFPSLQNFFCSPYS